MPAIAIAARSGRRQRVVNIVQCILCRLVGIANSSAQRQHGSSPGRAAGARLQRWQAYITLWVAAVAMSRSESSFGNNCDDRKIQFRRKQTFCRSKQHRLQMIGKNHQKQQVGSGREARCTRHHRPSAHTPPATFPRRHKPVTVCKSMAPFTVSAADEFHSRTGRPGGGKLPAPTKAGKRRRRLRRLPVPGHVKETTLVRCRPVDVTDVESPYT